MSKLGGDHSSSYWPGYVDALVNVVLNLMFLAAILAAGSFFQGLESARRRVANVPAGEPAARVKPGHRALTSAESGSPIQAKAASQEKMQLSLRFADNAVRLDDKARERLKRELLLQMSQGMQYWQVSIDVDVDDNLQRRAAYLRMISVRSVFLEAGIDPARFSLRMQPTAIANVGQQVLHIVPERRVPERKSPADLHEDGADGNTPQPEGRRRPG